MDKQTTDEIEKEIDEVVESFFENFINNQQELGSEFEEVLYTNLWDLYSSN